MTNNMLWAVRIDLSTTVWVLHGPFKNSADAAKYAVRYVDLNPAVGAQVVGLFPPEPCLMLPPR